jgi:plasmid replication initiation protein
MYKDLADAIEDLKEKGIENIIKHEDEEIVNTYLSQVDQMEIIDTFSFDSGTDPGDESTLYVIKTPGNEKKYLVASYGSYVSPLKTKLLCALLPQEKEQKN